MAMARVLPDIDLFRFVMIPMSVPISLEPGEKGDEEPGSIKDNLAGRQREAIKINLLAGILRQDDFNGMVLKICGVNNAPANLLGRVVMTPVWSLENLKRLNDINLADYRERIFSENGARTERKGGGIWLSVGQGKAHQRTRVGHTNKIIPTSVSTNGGSMGFIYTFNFEANPSEMGEKCPVQDPGCVKFHQLHPKNDPPQNFQLGTRFRTRNPKAADRKQATESHRNTSNMTYESSRYFNVSVFSRKPGIYFNLPTSVTLSPSESEFTACRIKRAHPADKSI
ncbi:hypothetical protein C8R43DRAFT_950115 [Mycena crocata]|nr:hypothetical protein C8R43DRAFT_950115 [Mycena crocata]